MKWPNRVRRPSIKNPGKWVSHDPTAADLDRREELERCYQGSGKFPKVGKQ